jgi:P2 family phage contractile tail tube protein
MILGNKVIQYSVYDRTSGKAEFICDTSSYKRPSLETLTDTVKGAGIMGEIDLPTLGQLASMEIEIGFKNSNEKAVDLFSQKTHEIETRWVTDALNTKNANMKTVAHKEIVKCISKKLDLGNIEANAANEATLTAEAIFYKYIIDGKAMIEIDKLNNVFKINGKDYAEQIRQAL